MTQAARSIYLFSWYIFPLSILVMAKPDLVTLPLGLPAPREPYVRVIGLILFFLAYYYRTAALSNWRAFFVASVKGRLGILLGFGIFILLKLMPPQLLLFAGADVIGAIWTFLALRADARARSE